MVTLAFLLAAFLDPIQAALVFAILLLYRGPQPILIAAAAAAAVSETVIMLAAVDYTWGELIAPRLVASLMQAVLLAWIVRLLRPSAAGAVARSGAQRLAGNVMNVVAALGSLAAASQAQRLAPWHMRAYVRRRLLRLRSR
jgi:hypothetical protein